MIVAGGMVGAGVYSLPSSLAAFGSISILGWGLAIAGAALLAGVFSWLAILRPGGAGMFAYIREAFGPGVGFVVAVLYWCPISLLPIALGVTGYIGFFVPALAHGLGSTLTTLAVVWILVGVNIVGARFVARFGGWTLLIGLAPILLVAIGGWFYFKPAVFAGSWSVNGQSALTAIPQSSVIAFFALLGIENALVISPLLRNPARDVPIATFGGLAIAGAVYLAASGAIMGLLPAAVLAVSTAPFADAARPIVGASIAGLIALCAMLKASGTLSSAYLVVVETAESDAVLGALRGPRPPRPADETPRVNLAVAGAILSLGVIASASPTLARQVTIAANIAVVLSTIAYLAACLAILRIARDAPAGQRWMIRRLGLAGAVFCCALIAVSEADLLVWSAGATVLATAVWFVVTLQKRMATTVTDGP